MNEGLRRVEKLASAQRPRDPRLMIDEEEIEDALFWANLHGIERIEFKTLRQWLADGGFVLPANPPDDRLSAELNTLLGRLAGLGVVVEFADHLSDRELYSWLLESGHLEAHFSPLPDSFVHIDVIGSGSDEDNRLYLTYYASDEERAQWKERFPDEELPPRQKLPYDGDRRSARLGWNCLIHPDDLYELGGARWCSLVQSGVSWLMAQPERVVRQSISLPSGIARRVKTLAKRERTSANRVIVNLIETGLEAREREKRAFFELAEKLANSSNAAEQKRLKEELARMTFGE
jgi:hypothetical protein